MIKKAVFIFCILSLYVVADPTVNSVTGTIEHDGVITISGSDFGTKNPAAPLMWDNGEGKTLNDPDILTQVTGYSEAWPDNRFDVRDPWKLQYRSEGFRGVVGAHGHSSNYITGGHWNDHDDAGRNVALTTDSGTFTNEWYTSWYVRLDPQWPTYDYACTTIPNYKDFVFQTGTQSYTYPPGAGIFRYSACTQCIAREEAMIDMSIQQVCGVMHEDPEPRPSELFGWKRREVIFRNSPGSFDTFSYDGTIGMQAHDISCNADLVDYGIRSFTVGGFARNSDSSQPNNPPYDYPNWSPIRDLTDHWYTWVQRGTSDIYYATFDGASVGDSSPDPWMKVSPHIVRIDGVDSRTPGNVDTLGYGEWAYGDFDGLGYNTMYARMPSGAERNPGDNGPCYLILTDDRQSQKGNGRQNPDSFRYFDDIYIDTTWSRVVLANNADYDQATIVEPQIPSAWSSGSITAEMNLGAIIGDAYLFVFDADNSHNAVGYLMGASSGINAASCSRGDVQTAVDSASDGETVNIPAGSCTWTDSVDVIDKDIKIVGAGQGSTVITYNGPDAYDSAAFLIDNDNLPKDNFEISQLTIINGMGDSASGATLIMVWDAGPDWRIHQITLTSEYSGNMIHVGRYTGSNGGLVDHCTFNKLGSGHTKGLQISATDRDVEQYNSATTPLGHTSWNTPISLGTKNALFIEDCIFNWEDDYALLDVDEGGRVVFRYNTILGADFGTHGHDGGSRDTGVFSYEIYANSFDADGTGLYTAIGLRGGTGVIYDNTFSGNYGATTNLYHYCACDPTVTCNGGWPTPCTYPCEGQIGRTAGNALEPLYLWDNVYNDGLPGPAPFDSAGQCDEIHDIIQEGRDYFSNTEKPGYVPYIYPHPLVGGVICVHAADNSPCDGDVSLSEIISYVEDWKAGSASMENLMIAVNIWKS